MKLRQITSALRSRNFTAQPWIANANVAARLYSTQKLAQMDASKLTITKTTTPKELTPPEELVFGRTFTDHMLSCEWTAKDGEFSLPTALSKCLL
jgi:hypothetical protein